MHGLHLTADLRGCAPGAAVLVEESALRNLCLAEVRRAGLTPVAERFHTFGPGQGLTGVVLLAESHVAVHTWPELRGVTLDVYVCNFGADNTARARGLAEALVAAFAPAHVQRHELTRGGA